VPEAELFISVLHRREACIQELFFEFFFFLFFFFIFLFFGYFGRLMETRGSLVDHILVVTPDGPSQALNSMFPAVLKLCCVYFISNFFSQKK
jgi:hypothetical protein